MLKQVNFMTRSEDQKVLFMDRVAWYIRDWDYDHWYAFACDGERAEPYFTFSEFAARWKCNLYKCFDHGVLWFEADAGVGCKYDLSIKIIPEDGTYTVIMYSNIMEPFLMGVAPDLYTAMWNAVAELEAACGRRFE